jgi:hypothetical protein
MNKGISFGVFLFFSAFSLVFALFNNEQLLGPKPTQVSFVVAQDELLVTS